MQNHRKFQGNTMNSVLRLSGCAAAVFLGAALIGGCASDRVESRPSMAMSSGAAGQMDMQRMCEMHKSMMAGKSAAEQQAMMNEHMKSMSPEMRSRMQAMHEQCRGS